MTSTKLTLLSILLVTGVMFTADVIATPGIQIFRAALGGGALGLYVWWNWSLTSQPKVR